MTIQKEKFMMLTRSKEKEHSRAFGACETKRCYNQLSTPLRKGGICRASGKISHQEPAKEKKTRLESTRRRKREYFLFNLI
jgi:hypothetical protein